MRRAGAGLRLGAFLCCAFAMIVAGGAGACGGGNGAGKKGGAGGSIGGSGGVGGLGGADGGLVGCLDTPGALDQPPAGRLPCDLVPPGLRL